ncbi:MAG: hypothetical protein OEY05_14375, partial [Paracoccaceae bacterium]|nr:hypothetical protein [Paracoccaceae bacterium]
MRRRPVSGSVAGMVTAADIKDQESLERWLKGRSQPDAGVIASRSACRVLPLFGRAMDEDWARKGDLTALPILRLLLTLRAARKFPALKVRAAAAAAATFAASTATVAADAARTATFAADAARTATFAATAATFA